MFLFLGELWGGVEAVEVMSRGIRFYFPCVAEKLIHQKVACE